MKKITLMAPAKLNLALDILGRLNNGYHTVDMIMQTVSLYDIVTIQKSEQYALSLSNKEIPIDENNTATLAANLFFAETDIQETVSIKIEKNIPPQAGMAGGSADAAAVLVGLNHLFETKLSLEELCMLGAKIGADVPFSIIGGTARATGFGEIIHPLPPAPHCWFTIGMPSTGNSTPEAYARYDRLGSPLHPDISALQAALQAPLFSAIVRHMHNALEFANGDNNTRRIRYLLDQHGALASMMTGSGAAVFGIFSSKSTAKKAEEIIRPITLSTYVVEPVPFGAKIIE